LHIQWCMKGIKQRPGMFEDSHALEVFEYGIRSNWLWSNPLLALPIGLKDGQQALSDSALLNHVNDYASVTSDTPYISLSAGVIVPHDATAPSEHPAWFTALDFATDFGRQVGYVYRLWTIVSPKPAPKLLNVSDSVRDLNQFRQFWHFHDEGEIAAKLLVPAAQIEWVAKVGAPGPPSFFHLNTLGFVDPRDICNLVEEL
jgi:hypothetical protein